MKQQFVVTYTIRQTQIPELLGSWVTNTPYVKILCPQYNYLSFYFPKNVTCLSVGLVRIGQVFSVSYKIVYRWVTTDSCCMSDIVQFVQI